MWHDVRAFFCKYLAKSSVYWILQNLLTDGRSDPTLSWISDRPICWHGVGTLWYSFGCPVETEGNTQTLVLPDPRDRNDKFIWRLGIFPPLRFFLTQRLHVEDDLFGGRGVGWWRLDSVRITQKGSTDMCSFLCGVSHGATLPMNGRCLSSSLSPQSTLYKYVQWIGE